MWTCIYCGLKNDSNNNTCTRCGTEKEKEGGG